MKAVILAGGLGTRLSEETVNSPKPLVKIGEFPILWHIMKIYEYNGITDFIICLGYKGNLIKQYFSEYTKYSSDIKVDLKNDKTTILKSRAENWTVTLVDTGLNSMTGGRLKMVEKYLENEDTFCFTYGDGVGDIDVCASINFHKKHKKTATVTAVTPPGRFGVLDIDGDNVLGFREKIASDQYKINAGFFVLDQKAFDYLEDEKCIWEDAPMIGLARSGQLQAWHHKGFWMPMDTVRDKQALNDLWDSNKAPWKTWA